MFIKNKKRERVYWIKAALRKMPNIAGKWIRHVEEHWTATALSQGGNRQAQADGKTTLFHFFLHLRVQQQSSRRGWKPI
jgi:hypothetical protein